MKISLLCPSRERLNKFLTFTCSVFCTAKDINNIELVLGVDEDDPKFDEYLKIADNLSFVKLIVFEKGVFKEGGLSALWNEMVKNTSGDILAMVGDDMVFKTNDWDQKIIDIFESKSDNIYLIHCNDGMRGYGNGYAHVEPFAVNSFIHRDYVDAIGWYVQDVIPETFQDTYLDKVFGLIGRKLYSHAIIIKHNHYSYGGEMDDVSKRLEATRKGIWDNQSIFDERLMPLIKEEVLCLRDLIER
tara:strand:- start:7228 stop:7959 length:732 start_codon:yes stop_codon:yes gene_type:complete